MSPLAAFARAAVSVSPTGPANSTPPSVRPRTTSCSSSWRHALAAQRALIASPPPRNAFSERLIVGGKTIPLADAMTDPSAERRSTA